MTTVHYYHGRRILRVPATALVAALIEQRDALKEELLWTQDQMRELQGELRALKAAVLARNRADAELASLYREAAIQRAQAVVRDPATMALH
jgi:hypothetical protein